MPIPHVFSPLRTALLCLGTIGSTMLYLLHQILRRLNLSCNSGRLGIPGSSVSFSGSSSFASMQHMLEPMEN